MDNSSTTQLPTTWTGLLAPSRAASDPKKRCGKPPRGLLHRSLLAETVSQPELCWEAAAQPQSCSALSPGRPGSSRSLAAEVRRRHRSLPRCCLRAHGEPLSKGRRRCAGTLQTLQAWAGTRCLGRCGEGFGFVAETAGSSAALSHEALSGAGPARRAQLQLGGQFSVMFLLGVFRMPMVSGGKIHACEVLLLSPSLCVILSLSGI